MTTLYHRHQPHSNLPTNNNHDHQLFFTSSFGKYLLLLTLFLIFTSAAAATLNCTYSHSDTSDSSSTSSNIYEYSSLSPPVKGTCRGPMHRTISAMNVISKLNLGCPRNQIPYSKEGVLQIQCGECIPGTSGTSNLLNSFQCAVNEYCTDGGKCKLIKEHPLYGADCPFEVSSSIVRSDIEGIDTWCGTGLICVQHKCVSCREGDVDMNTGVKCILGEWTYASWMDSTLEPSPLLLFALCGITLLYALVNCSCRSVKLLSKVVDDYKEGKEHESIRKLTQEFVSALEKVPENSNQEPNNHQQVLSPRTTIKDIEMADLTNKKRNK